MLLNNNQIKYHTSGDVSVIEIKDGQGVTISIAGGIEMSGYGIGVSGKNITMSAKDEIDMTCCTNSLMMLTEGIQQHYRTLSGNIELESPENIPVVIIDDVIAMILVSAYKQRRKSEFPKVTPEGIVITPSNKNDAGIMPMLREYWEKNSGEYKENNDIPLFAGYRDNLIGMTKNYENFQKWMMNQFRMTEEERRNHTFEGKIDTISEMAGTVMEIMFLANMGTMAKNDFNNMMNSSGGIALQNKVNGVKAGAANAFNGVGRRELALPGGGTIEWVEGRAVPIQFATGGNAGGVVPPILPGGTNSGNNANDFKDGKDELLGRKGAFKKAKKDARIPRAQQPEKVEYVLMQTAEYEGGHVIKDANNNVINTREYTYTNINGKKIVIQDHGAGHAKGGQGAHFNVRPADKTRTGNVIGAKDHYPFNN